MLPSQVNLPAQIIAYSPADAAKALGIGRTKLYALIAEAKIEALSIGSRTVIPADSLRAFLSTLAPAPIRKTRP
jgi:excisionase family DNA binding protein